MANRKAKHKGLPPNLYASTNGHYRYRRPDTGKWYSVGKDRNAATAAAKQLNSQLRTTVDIVEKVVNGNAVLFKDFLRQFEANILPTRELSKNSLEYYRIALSRFHKQFGDKPTEEITVQDVAALLDNLRPETANKHRGILLIIFKYAIAKGLCHDNPVSKTLPYKRKKARRRLALEGYLAIYNHPNAEPWFKNAMDLALQTLQRRGDVLKMQFTDERDGHLHVIQQKTEKHGAAAHLKIKIGQALRAVIDRCHDEIDSPYLVHRVPSQVDVKNYQAKNKQHYTQIAGKYLTVTFAAIRDKLDCFQSMPKGERPTFHEIRSLGIKLYEEKGFRQKKH